MNIQFSEFLEFPPGVSQNVNYRQTWSGIAEALLGICVWETLSGKSKTFLRYLLSKEVACVTLSPRLLFLYNIILFRWRKNMLQYPLYNPCNQYKPHLMPHIYDVFNYILYMCQMSEKNVFSLCLSLIFLCSYIFTHKKFARKKQLKVGGWRIFFCGVLIDVNLKHYWVS